MTYEVETIGNVVEGTACACNKPRRTIGDLNLDDLGWLFPPLWPVVLGRKVAQAATGGPSTSVIQELADQLGINPVAFAIGATGYAGIEEYVPAARVVGVVAAVAGAVLVARELAKKSKKRGKHVRSR